MNEQKLPLAGVRVVEFVHMVMGPTCGLVLADLGAEVIKIENHLDGGDFGRDVGPHFFGPKDSQFYETFNRNKKSITLDLRRAAARAILAELARGADALGPLNVPADPSAPIPPGSIGAGDASDITSSIRKSRLR